MSYILNYKKEIIKQKDIAILDVNKIYEKIQLTSRIIDSIDANEVVDASKKRRRRKKENEKKKMNPNPN